MTGLADTSVDPMATTGTPVNPMAMTGRRILVTGASSGIGRATAQLLAGLGAEIVATGRDAGRLGATIEALPGPGHRGMPFDLQDIDAIPRFVQGVAEAGGALTGIAHCAGIQIGKPVRAADQAFMDQMFRVNVETGIALARGLRQRGVAASGASLVLLGSVSALVGQASNVVYCASKGAVLAATRALAVELMRDGIRVNAVLPALVETEMAARFRTTMTEVQWQGYLAQYPMGIGRPEDIANVVAFLLSAASRWINGIGLVIDGGVLAG
jgi:NAD(P)-dependent dehydrogenase (short-subunit alcohol dehydrogenase family)